ncbi:hypothetical protein JCM8547_003273 [Rhodosporidiobolus lusitaniae]
MAALFKPLKVGRMQLQHRVSMAPLTRFRAEVSSSVPQEPAAIYYSQRGSAPGTLLITEATIIDPRAGNYDGVPALYSDEQIAGWKKVVDAVHEKKSFIYAQLWALGRAADPNSLKKAGPFDIVSASSKPFEGGATPRPLTKIEIQDYVSYYARAAKNFVKGAGGDGVEIHGANGYLLDQFLQTTCNERTDEYGGSVENRARFLLDTVDAVVEAVGADRTGIRLSPFSTFQGMKMELKDIKETFSYVVEQLRLRHPDLAYIHCVESRIAGNQTVEADKEETLDFIRDLWAPRPFLVAGGFTDENGAEIAEKYENTVIVYGRYFISNPDLVHRLKNHIPLTPYDRDTFYLVGPHETRGYIDYPFADKAEEKEN